MHTQLYELDQHNLQHFMHDAGDAILRVTVGDDIGMPAAIVRYFDGVYPRAMRYGTIRREAAEASAWWRARFPAAAGATPPSGPAGAVGFHLFVKGAPITWSAGESRPEGVDPIIDLIVQLVDTYDETPKLREAARASRMGVIVIEAFEAHLRGDAEAKQHLVAKGALSPAEAEAEAKLQAAARRLQELFEAAAEEEGEEEGDDGEDDGEDEVDEEVEVVPIGPTGMLCGRRWTV